jgi:hypothetical protein
MKDNSVLLNLISFLFLIEASGLVFIASIYLFKWALAARLFCLKKIYGPGFCSARTGYLPKSMQNCEFFHHRYHLRVLDKKLVCENACPFFFKNKEGWVEDVKSFRKKRSDLPICYVEITVEEIKRRRRSLRRTGEISDTVNLDNIDHLFHPIHEAY